jgi:putative phosphoribosyl transferase
MHFSFENRRDAGRELGKHLARYAHRDDVSVFALPRGGVPVAFEVALALDVALDVLVVRKLGVPSQPELAMGAIASGDAFYLDEQIVDYAGVSRDALAAVIARERIELERREKIYRGDKALLDIDGRVVILVDDGMATGATMTVAAMSLRHAHQTRIVAAVPVAPLDSKARLKNIVDEFVCVLEPPHFFGVGQFYADFEQTSDQEVRDLLEQALKR